MKRLAAAVALLAAGCGNKPADPTIVRVQLEGATRAAETATGFALRPGRVVTVAHVLAPHRRLVIRSGAKTYGGRVLRIDRRNDLALIAVPGIGSGSAALHPGLGTGPVRVIVERGARSAVLDARIRRPIRAAVRTPASGPYRRRAIELEARVHLGDSGAPVVDRDGRVAGVVFARASNGSPTAYAVDASALHSLLTR